MRVAVLVALVALAGCTPAQRIVVLAPPAGYLEPCDLPPRPVSNADLSRAFAQAYRCAALGNKDKERIATWTENAGSRQ